MKIIKDNFFLGTGIKGFRYLCRNKIYILDQKYDGCSTHPHNTYLHILTSNGFIGFFLLVFAYVYIIIQMLRVRKKINLENNINEFEISKSILLAGFFINFWPFIPSGNFFNNWLSIFYFYQIGFYLYFTNQYER